ncbi:MAG: hypothetical protein HYW05_00845 [Candidatus Diapherotrites archaeon]|nr:hypothetical protein [Candidatus Diapherotrites archaeon]
MESICIRVEKPVAEEIEKCMRKFHYSTKTEFIREALRDKLKEIEEKEKKEAWEKLFALRGAFKGMEKAQTDEEWHKLKEKAGMEFIKKMEKKFNQK